MRCGRSAFAWLVVRALATLLTGTSTAAAAAAAVEEVRTVCTITVNSADEKEAFARWLPRGRYRFVELVESSRSDWLQSACEQRVACDVLVVSGHFDGANEFFSDRLASHESLTLTGLERASCSDACTTLFAQLKEVYLFGCNTLNPVAQGGAGPEVVRSIVRQGRPHEDAERQFAALTAGYGESSRERMRQIFKDVPVIYGFSSTAPRGPLAGAALEQYLRRGGTREFGKGHGSAQLLSQFLPYSITMTTGMVDADPRIAARNDMCEFSDPGRSSAQRLAFVHEVLRRQVGEARLYLERIRLALSDVDVRDRELPSVAAELQAIADDDLARRRFLGYARETEAPVRLRMLEVARDLGWLPGEALWQEQATLLADLQSRPDIGVAEVNLACTLNAEHAFDGVLDNRAPAVRSATAHAALRACLGSADGHTRTLAALLADNEADTLVAQAYLRHRPITDAPRLRALAAGIATMPTSPAQVRALEALGRHYLSDPLIVDVMTDLFAQTPSPQVQAAIAGLLLRADREALATPRVLKVLREHRRDAPATDDVVDALIRRLQPSS